MMLDEEAQGGKGRPAQRHGFFGLCVCVRALCHQQSAGACAAAAAAAVCVLDWRTPRSD